MNYIETNKSAWEEAFDNRIDNFGEKIYLGLLGDEYLPFIDESMKEELTNLNLEGKSVAHFCCNNGRELLSAMKLGISQGTGFDIAENIIKQAKETAVKAEISNCKFLACNILEIPDKYYESFDLIFFTVGAITWFKNLEDLFQIANKCLKKNGKILISDFHPVLNMLAMPNEPDFEKNNIKKLIYSYFRSEAWIENEGMTYISGEYPSKTFTSFSHTMSSIINSLSKNGLQTVLLNEYDYDIGFSDIYDHQGIPLSFTLIAEKN